MLAPHLGSPCTNVEQHLIRAKAAIDNQTIPSNHSRDATMQTPETNIDAGNLALSAHPHGRAAAGHKKICCHQVVPTHRYHWLDVCFMPYLSCPSRPTGVGMAPFHPVTPSDFSSLTPSDFFHALRLLSRTPSRRGERSSQILTL